MTLQPQTGCRRDLRQQLQFQRLGQGEVDFGEALFQLFAHPIHLLGQHRWQGIQHPHQRRRKAGLQRAAFTPLVQIPESVQKRYPLGVGVC